MDSWWIDTDNCVQITGLKDVVTDQYVNDATVTGVLTDKNGNTVTGAGSLSFEYISGSNGNYAGEIPSTVTLTEGEQYTLTITAMGGGFKLTVKITRRSAYKGP
jgi:hypothetical protein